MKFLKFIACFLALIIMLNTCAFALPKAATASTTQQTSVDNQKLMLQKLYRVMKKNGLNKDNFAFGYYDIFRDFECCYNGKKLFEPYEMIKFPLAFLYYNEYTKGKYTFSSEIGGKKFADIFVESLTKDNTDATDTLIEKYGGLTKVKNGMRELTNTKVPAAFNTTTQMNVEYCVDFLELYYSTAKFSSTDFRNLMVDSLKEFTPGRYSEKYITEYRITHRYGYSEVNKAATDMGIVKSDYPFVLVIFVDGVDNAEGVLAEVAKFAYDYNEDFGALLLSQMTTLPDIPEDKQKTYTTRSYTKPILISVIVFGVAAVAGVAIFFVYRDRKLRKLYEADDE